jgi:hypothetical protein
MKSKVLRVSVLTILSVGIWLTICQQTANAQATVVRWDMIYFAQGRTGFGFFPGGKLSATAVDGSQITLTGTGTFVQPPSGEGTSNTVTGGGTWGTNSPRASGTYTVTGFVEYVEAPGTLAGSGLVDNIGDINDTHAGLGIFSILYSDGERGILVLSCNLGPPAPSVVYEGAHATKGFVDYFNPVLGADEGTNATMFHFAE